MLTGHGHRKRTGWIAHNRVAISHVTRYDSRHTDERLVADLHALFNAGVCTDISSSANPDEAAEHCCWGNDTVTFEQHVVPDRRVRPKPNMIADRHSTRDTHTEVDAHAASQRRPRRDGSTWMHQGGKTLCRKVGGSNDFWTTAIVLVAANRIQETGICEPLRVREPSQDRPATELAANVAVVIQKSSDLPGAVHSIDRIDDIEYVVGIATTTKEYELFHTRLSVKASAGQTHASSRSAAMILS